MQLACQRLGREKQSYWRGLRYPADYFSGAYEGDYSWNSSPVPTVYIGPVREACVGCFSEKAQIHLPEIGLQVIPDTFSIWDR